MVFPNGFFWYQNEMPFLKEAAFLPCADILIFPPIFLILPLIYWLSPLISPEFPPILPSVGMGRAEF